jgi:hypothetical protein
MLRSLAGSMAMLGSLTTLSNDAEEDMFIEMNGKRYKMFEVE